MLQVEEYEVLILQCNSTSKGGNESMSYYCPTCGAAVDDNANFCPTCGNALTVTNGTDNAAGSGGAGSGNGSSALKTAAIVGGAALGGAALSGLVRRMTHRRRPPYMGPGPGGPGGPGGHGRMM